MSADFSFDTLPDDWLPDSIGGLFDVQQGKALSPEARGGVSRRPFLRTRNVLWGKLDLADVDTMSFDEGEASRLTLQDRDLLVCEGGEIGRTAIWRNELPGCLYQNHIHRLRRKTDEIDPEFVMYWLQAAFLRLGLYEGIGNRTTIPNLSGARLRVLQVPAPRVGEQVAIANVLSKLHETVENSARRIAAFQDLTAATVEKLFHEGTQGEALKATPIGLIPEGWSVLAVGALVRFRSGPPRPADMLSGRNARYRYPVFGGNGVMGFTPTPFLPADAVVIGRVGAYCGAVHVAPAGSWVTDNALYHDRAPSLDVSVKYLAEALKRAQLNQLKRTGAQPLVTQGLVHAVEIPLPRRDEQESIVATLEAIESARVLAEQRKELLNGTFEAGLQLLMTGRLRIAGARSEAAHA